MPMIRNILILSFSTLMLSFVPTALGQVSDTVSNPSTTLSPNKPTAENTPGINKGDLKIFLPSLKEKLLRSWQYQFQIQEQPAFVVASSGGTTSTVPNPNKWLLEHSITLTLSELFPKVTNLPDLVAAAYDSIDSTAAEMHVGSDICKSEDVVKCLARGGDFSAGNFFARLFSGASVTFSESQRDEFQQGVIVTSQGRAFGYDINFDPTSLFVTSENWTKVNAALSNRSIDRGTGKGEDCIVAHVPPSTPIEDCEKLFARPRLYASNRLWGEVAAVMIPSFKMQALSQFDFLKQGGILVQSPLLQRTLKNFTLTWDLGRLLPATSDKLAIEKIYYPKPKNQSEGEIKIGNVVQLKSGGPDMTVDSIEKDGETTVAACSWFSNSQRESGQFPVGTLKRISE